MPPKGQRMSDEQKTKIKGRKDTTVVRRRREVARQETLLAKKQAAWDRFAARVGKPSPSVRPVDHDEICRLFYEEGLRANHIRMLFDGARPGTFITYSAVHWHIKKDSRYEDEGRSLNRLRKKIRDREAGQKLLASKDFEGRSAAATKAAATMRADPERQAQAAHKRAIVYTPERHAEAARKRAATMGHEAMSAMAIIAAAKQSAKALSARARKGKASMGAERRRKAALKGSEARTHEQRSLSAQQAVKTVGHDGCVARAIKGHATRRAKTGMPAGIQLRADGYFAVFALKSDYGKSIYIGYCKTIEDAIATQKQFYLDHPASSSSDDHPKKRKFVD